MDKDRIEQGMLVAQEGVILSKIDLQVLFHLLIEKGILTKDEIQAERNYISNQPLYQKKLKGIAEMQSENANSQYFQQELEKYISSDRKEGDIDFINKMLGIN